MLSGIDGVLQFLDELLISRKTKEHLTRLHKVFQMLGKVGLVLGTDKCLFFFSKFSIKAIFESERPRNVSELKSFLGLANYYRNFVTNASSVLSPLHKLLQKNKRFEIAFDCIHIKILLAVKALAHFNPDAKIILTTRRISVRFRYNIVSNRGRRRKFNFVRIEVATAIIFGIRKFHHYLYGRKDAFVSRTDHKPLLSIFRPSNRLQRYALFLTACNYIIKYVPNSYNSADFLSRSVAFCSPDSNELGDIMVNKARGRRDAPTPYGPDLATYIKFIWQPQTPPVKDVHRETEIDSLFKQVAIYEQKWWPNKDNIKSELKPYYECRLELAVEQGCLIRGNNCTAILKTTSN